MALYSHSRLSTFEQCSLKYRFQYIDKVEPDFETTIEAFMGSMVHNALEKLYKDLKFQKMNTLPELLDFYNSQWVEKFNDKIDIVRKEYSAENYRKMGEGFITDYYEKHKPFDGSKTVSLETQYTAKLDDRYRIHIRIDRLAVKDGVFEIHDYKTSNSLPTQEKVDNDRQLAVYAFGLKQLYPDSKKIRLVWHYLAFNKELLSERTDKQLREMKEQVLSLIKDVENCKDFRPVQSALCDWCQFRSKCPNFKHLYKKGTLKEHMPDDGEQLADSFGKVSGEMAEKQEELEKIRAKLISFAEKEGLEVVYGKESKVSIKSYPKMKFPSRSEPEREKFEQLIKQLGLWDELATVDVYELAKMINNGEIHIELVRLLDQFIKKEKTTYVRAAKR